MTEAETTDKKDITEEIIDFDFDKFESEQTPTDDDPTICGEPELNAYVGILDMLITSSGDMLKAEGYPEPNLKIWDTWGKENLSKAFDAYLPEIEGDYSPMVCGFMGLGAIGLCYLPVILKFVETQNTESIEPPKQQAQPEPQTQTSEAPATYEEPEQVKPTSTAPISGHTRTVFERLEAGATIPGL